MLGAAREGASPLLGREAETTLLTSLFDGIPGRGGALVLRGEPGIGKWRRRRRSRAIAAWWC
jgi:hypothetical protein